MKRTVSLIVSLILLLSLTGCEKYKSKYKAIGFVHSNTSASAEMSFYSFEGTMVFKLKSKGEGDLKYTAKLATGTAAVYYDYNGTKAELFTIGAGEETDSHGGYVESGTVYLIVETDGACENGAFSFRVE
ncbi:MAG: hypothetical protein IK080_09050 [Clostridia bacterium]|nr:hypothetical protein [Clostridia bacterium]